MSQRESERVRTNPLNLLSAFRLVVSEVGGCESGVSPPPNREIDFGFGCDCVACVRASERSCVCEMIPLWLGSGGQICGYPSVRPSVRPGAGPDIKLELFEF